MMAGLIPLNFGIVIALRTGLAFLQGQIALQMPSQSLGTHVVVMEFKFVSVFWDWILYSFLPNSRWIEYDFGHIKVFQLSVIFQVTTETRTTNPKLVFAMRKAIESTSATMPAASPNRKFCYGGGCRLRGPFDVWWSSWNCRHIVDGQLDFLLAILNIERTSHVKSRICSRSYWWQHLELCVQNEHRFLNK